MKLGFLMTPSVTISSSITARPTPLENSALDLTSHRLGVQSLAHVLGGVDLHHRDETQLGVHVDDGAMARNRKVGMDHSTALLVRPLCRWVAENGSFLPTLVDQLIHRHHQTSLIRDAFITQLVASVVGEDSVPQPRGGRQRGPTAHLRLPRRRCGPSGPDGRRVHVNHTGTRHAERRSSDLSQHRDQTLADFDGGSLDYGPVGGESDPCLGIVVRALRKPQILDTEGISDPPLHVLLARGPAASSRKHPLPLRRQRHGEQGVDHFNRWKWCLDFLTRGGHVIAAPECIAAA